jgi:DNA-directed RNA polymerase specialized sigma24 family protein
MGEGRLSGDESPSNRRLTVPQAAATLGITESAVRGRLKRGTLRSHREAGTVYVILDALKPGASSSAGRGPPTDQSELVAVLREQLAAERQAHAEARRLLMAALERIPPAIEAPRESPETAAEPSEGAEPHSEAPGAQEGTQRRSWWRRMFGR